MLKPDLVALQDGNVRLINAQALYAGQTLVTFDPTKYDTQQFK